MVNRRFTLMPLAMLMAIAPEPSLAENIFNPAFLDSDPSAVADLSRFEQGAQAAGTYRVDMLINDEWVATRDIAFTPESGPHRTRDDSGLVPCLTVETLDELGVNTAAKPELSGVDAATCVDLLTLFPGSGIRFDFDSLRLNLSVPQAMMNHDARGYIPPSQWDEGINALLLNYTFTGSSSQDKQSGSENSSFLGLNSGFNYGAWRLRDYATWTYSESSQQKSSRWRHINTYLQRALIPLKSELTLGDSNTPADVFDSLNFRGVQIASDDSMLPDSLRGFAPTIRGIANSHAQVTIRQNGFVLYQTYVPPGAFVINDLFPTSSSGDLVVEVKESDGSVNVYSVPYSSVPVLQRDGHIKYAITGGNYRSNNDLQENVSFVQSTLIWGLPKGLTVYGGEQYAENYQALALGLGMNVGSAGAVSLDVTQARSTLNDGSKHAGSSLRFLYAKSLNTLGTHFQLLGYRYSTQGFYTLDETTWKQMSGYATSDNNGERNPSAPLDYYNLNNNKRDKFQLTISQQLGSSGSLYLSGSHQSYWRTSKANTLMQTGYSGNIKGVSWNLNYSYNRLPGLDGADNRISLMFSVPLNLWLSPGGDITRQQHSAYASYSVSNDTKGHTTQSAGLNGTLLEDDNLSYSVEQGYQNQNGHGNGAVGLNYDGSWGSASVGYNYNESGDYRQMNYGLNGGIVVHNDGITLSQPLGETNVLIAAPGAGHIKVDDVDGLSTDWRGYAVVPYATLYRRNRMSLDTTSMPANVDLEDNVVSVVPTRGALVKARFNAHVGARALLSLSHAGKPLPFGTIVNAESSSGIVGDEGQVYLSGLAVKGKLTAKWGEGAAHRCTTRYSLPDDADSQPINTLNLECQ